MGSVGRTGGLWLAVVSGSLAVLVARPAVAQAVPQFADAGAEIARGDELRERKQPKEAASAYERAMTMAGAAEAVQLELSARNRAATARLDAGDTEGALRLFQDGRWELADAEARANYFYNWGSALERAGRTAEALAKYEVAAVPKPNSRPAVRAAFRLLRNNVQAGTPEAEATLARWSRRLMVGGELDVTPRELKASILATRAAPSWTLFEALADYYVLGSVGAQAFADSEQPFLDQVREKWPEAKDVTGELVKAFRGEWKPRLGADAEGWARETFPTWARDDARRKRLGGLLRWVGDGYARVDRADLAWQRYAAAWACNPEDGAAALYCAAMLERLSRGEPGSAQKYADARREFIASLYEQKNPIHFKEGKTTQDLQTLLRLHVVLGTLFNQVGAESGGQHATALYHWEQASKVQGQLADRIPAYRPSPDVNRGYAKALAPTKPSAAFDQMINAAKLSLDAGDASGAARSLTELKGLKLKLNDDQSRQLESWGKRLGELPDRPIFRQQMMQTGGGAAGEIDASKYPAERLRSAQQIDVNYRAKQLDLEQRMRELQVERKTSLENLKKPQQNDQHR